MYFIFLRKSLLQHLRTFWKGKLCPNLIKLKFTLYYLIYFVQQRTTEA